MSELHERLKRRLSTMGERADESLFDGEDRKEEGTIEPERVLRGQRGEPKAMNRFQQLASLARRSDGREEDVEMNLLTKPPRILPPIGSDASMTAKSLQNEQAEITIATDQGDGEYIDTVFSRHTMDMSDRSDQTFDETGHMISPAISETSIDRSDEEMESTPLITPQSTILLTYTGPKYRPNAERISLENSVTFNKTGLFAPEDSPVALELKKEPGTELRDIREEGLYVPEVLTPPSRTLVAMEHRIVREGALSWFGENGQLKGLSGKFEYLKLKKDGDFPDREVLFRPPDRLVQYSPPLNIPLNERTLVLSNTHQQDPTVPTLNLSLYVSSLRFTHHSLFNEEHILCTTLYSLQLQYNKMRERERAEMCYRRLQALRRQLRSLKVELDRLRLRSLTGKEVEQKTNDISAIKREIIEYRQLRSIELEKEQNMLKSILKVWGQMKQLRQEQSHVSTAARLRIRREAIGNVEEDKLNFMTEMEQELVELREEFEEKLSAERINYEVEYDQWRRDQETRQDLTGSQTSGISCPIDTPAPVAPSEFEEDRIRRQLEEEYLANRRHPGQPILTPELYLNMPLTGVIEDQRELARKRDVEKLSYFLRVKVNGETVCETKHRKLKQDFITDFQEHFQLQLRHKPDSIILEVHQSSFTNSLIAEVPYPIPSSIPAQKPVTTPLYQSLDFSHEKVIPSKLGVGACVPMRGKTLPYTAGVVNTSLELYGQHGPTSDRIEWGRFGKFTKMPLDASKIRESLASARLDPNDPRNLPLLQLLRSLPDEDHGDAFTLTRMDMVRPFMTEIDFNANPAFKHFEDRHKFELSPTRSIRFEDELTRAPASPVGEHPDGTDTDFTPWHHGMESFYQSIRREITQQAKGPDYSLEEVVIEDPVPNLNILRNNIIALFSPKRPLLPKRVPRRTVPSRHANIRELNLVIRVLQGYNFPSRVSDSSEVISRQNRTRTATSLWRESSARGVGMVGVDRREEDVLSFDDDTYNETQPFIEVRFQGTTYRTKQSLGVNPNWNDELIIPYHPPTQTFSADSLISNNDVIYFNAFDLVRVDALEDERLRATNVQERLDYRWLGSFQIPFHTVLVNSRIDGTFKVRAPRILFGYEREGRMEDTDMQLSMFITLDPLIKPQKSIYAASLDKDDKKLIEKFKNEICSLSNDFPDRIFTISVGDIHGKQVLVNRYIAPLNPPDIFIPFDEHYTFLHLEKISRFVSLIPFLPDSQCLEGLSDVWVPAEEFLKLRCGDEEEHATLLLDYFLFLNVESWLVLGFAVPEGSTAYVLSRDKLSSSLSLWNPSTGERFATTDTNCPLLHVYTVVSAKKIHFNTQSSTKPSEIDYNFNNSRKWKTCSLPDWIMQYSLQPSELVYAPSNLDKAYKLQDMIQHQLQLKIESWRSRLVTQWNMPAGAMLGEHLVRFEESYPELPEAELKQAFESLFITYQIVGFPIHLTSTSFKGFEEQVYATGIHTCQEPGVEFVIACYVHPYPNEIFSTWLYMATMIPK